ncbi:MAG: hypothetical protein IPM55_21170 [Acidobacteria bacterium]|nr:hypothetical protein [Acidobacteriota bacterium]
MRIEDFGRWFKNMKNFKKYAIGLMVAGGLTFSLMSTVLAQNGQRRDGWDRRGQAQRDVRRQRNNGNGQVDRNGNIDRNRNGVDDRYENNRNGNVDRNRNGVYDRYENNRNSGVNRNGNIDRNRNGVDDRYENNGRYGRNDGYYGNNGNYGVYGNSAEMQKGYRDGLDRGQEDVRDRRIADPNNSSHYRKGSRDYKAGFRRGYNEGYNQYGNNRRW